MGVLRLRLLLRCSCHAVNVALTAVKSATRGFCDVPDVAHRLRASSKTFTNLDPWRQAEWGVQLCPPQSARAVGNLQVAPLTGRSCRGSLAQLFHRLRIIAIRSSTGCSCPSYCRPDLRGWLTLLRSTSVNSAARLKSIRVSDQLRIHLGTPSAVLMMYSSSTTSRPASTVILRCGLKPRCCRAQGTKFFPY